VTAERPAQVDMLLTLEEFCSEEGVFYGSGERGSSFVPIFGKVLLRVRPLNTQIRNVGFPSTSGLFQKNITIL
jgi:hypothetical protein